MISLLSYVLVLLIVMALVWWIVSQLPLPPLVRQIAIIVIVVICVIVLINLLLPLAGSGPHWNLR
jgi:hypothetical protein